MSAFDRRVGPHRSPPNPLGVLSSAARLPIVLAALVIPSLATAAPCDEFMNMVQLNIPSNIVVETIKTWASPITAADVECLQAKSAPADIIAAAQVKAGIAAAAPVTAAGPAPATPTPSAFDSEEAIGGATFPAGAAGAATSGDDSADAGEPEPSGGGPAELEQAIEAYRTKRYVTSSSALYEMLRDNRYPDQETKIQYYLAKSLYDMEMYHPAQHFFMEVVRKGPSNPYFKYAMPRLVNIAKHTGNDFSLLRIVDKIQPEAFPRGARSELYYLMGRKLFEKDELTQAAEYFAQVSSKSDLYMRAKYYEGIIHQERGKLRSAVMAFREVMTAQPPLVGDARTTQQIEDMKDLALINVARIYYNLQRFENADNYYEMVDRESSYWAESLFERAWTSFMQSDLNRALGLLLTVQSPYFTDQDFIPEVTYLRALTFFNLCEFNEVERILKNFQTRYTPMKDEMESFVNQYRDQKDLWDQAYDAYFTNRHDDSVLPEALFARILRNRDLAAMVRHLEMMDSEIVKINEQKAAWKDAVGQELIRVIEEDRIQYKKRAGALLLKEMLRASDNLKRLLTQSEIVQFEVVDAQRADYEFRAGNTDIAAKEDRPIDFATDTKIIYWPFNGEFWRDELGYYKYTEHGECQ